MSEQAKAVGVSDKMKAKDYITLGIFTVLCRSNGVHLCLRSYRGDLRVWERHCCNSWRHYLYADAR